MVLALEVPQYEKQADFSMSRKLVQSRLRQPFRT